MRSAVRIQTFLCPPRPPSCSRQVTELRAKLGEAAQPNPAGLVVDSRLRVQGAGGSILALGDAAITNQAG